MKKYLIILSIAITLLLVGGCSNNMTGNSTSSAPVTNGKYGTVDVDFYVMSQCPYGTQVEDGIKPVLDKLGDAVNFKLDFIVNDNGDGTFQSLHGQNEVDGNIVQLCAAKHEPLNYMNMVVCMNENANKIPSNWESCAEDAGLNMENIKECYEGDEGKELLSESAKRAMTAQASGSPTMFIGGEAYNGGRDELSFMRSICNQLNGHPACDEIPDCVTDADCGTKDSKIGICNNPGETTASCEYIEPVKTELLVLNDPECDSCDTTNIIEVSKNLFPGLVIKELDINSEEGQIVAEKLDITYIPSYIFDQKVAETYMWKNNPTLNGAFDQIGTIYKIKDEASGATKFADPEKEQEMIAKIGVTPGDNKPQIDFFVMSYCPYGNQAEEIVKSVYDNLGDSVEYIPRYVWYSNYQGGGATYCIDEDSKYCSMHGVQEANQNIRELCVYKSDGIEKWFDFAIAMNNECSASNADSCWESVAEDLELDTEAIKTCEETQAIELAAEDLELGTILGVRGSPSIFIEGQTYNGERSPAGFQSALCEAFEDAPEECNNVVESTQTAVQGQC